MNKAFLIVSAAIIIIVAGSFWYVVSRPTAPSADQNIPDPSQSRQVSEGAVVSWTLVSGNVTDTCTSPTFKGEVPVHVWYEEVTTYDSPAWLLHVSAEDIKSLPGTLLNVDYTRSPYLKATNLSDSQIRTLEDTDQNHTTIVVLTSFKQYCEGRALVEVKS